ncbi:SpoIIE family protein phosphatase [Streptomyces sp. NPDC004647]|uniref:SpoIIE family protein phosphatase n=1 Tax=Streptomyces sp. NPDC004647 TaxID=3154671 RepID=UPI0033B9E3AC
MGNPTQPGASGPRGPLQARRDEAMAAALRQLHTHLQASTSTIYLLTGDGQALAAGMSVDGPLAFTVIPEMPSDDLWHASSRAHHTRRLVVLRDTDIPELVHKHPELVVHTPWPMLVVSAPLQTPDRSFGAVTLRWTPPRPINDQALDFLTEVSKELAHDLESLAAQGISMEAPFVPLFIPAYDAPQAPASEPLTEPLDNQRNTIDSPAPGSTLLYQLLDLASDLTTAKTPRDVVAAAWTKVARPLGGTAVMLCLAENARLRVVGSAGVPKDSVRRVDGIPLSARTPETDTVTKIEPIFFATAQELHAAYPGVEWAEERAWSFLPLIANGRALGCCVLAFDPDHRLGFEARTLLMIMLGQVGQSLERARAYEVQQTLAQGLQQGLLPRTLPHLAEIDITARYIPANEGADVGGDWYDVIPLPDGGIGFVIGDVEGHSLEAAGVMGQIRTAVRSYAAEGHDPATVLTRSNRLIAELDTHLFATCCCLWLDLDAGAALVATAGHHPPVISDRAGQVTVPPLPVGPPLGIDPQIVYLQTEIEPPVGGIIALFTDGLFDTRRTGAVADIERLSRCLADGHAQNLETIADQLIDDSPAEAPRQDDAALLLLRYEGAQDRAHQRVARIFVQRHGLQQVSEVRRFLHSKLRDWQLLPLLDEVELLASEVVTNALIHAHSEVDVRVREYRDRLRVEVRDSDPHPPVPVVFVGPDQPGNQEAESGRGLLIVEAVASTWGSSPSGRGKTTWFELDIPSAP